MFNFYLTYQWLFWRRPSGPPPSVPDGLVRVFIATPSGPLEMLVASPPSRSAKRCPPLLFCHGGMGSAWVWAEYMQFLAAQGIPCYAVSLRGHGESWHPSYLHMVFGTTREMLEDDLLAGLRWVKEMEGSEVVLVGHSSGGGLSQALLAKGAVSVKGLVLVDAVPAFGSMDVYLNWAKIDPWFSIRMLLHGWHPNSPLSHPFLTKRAFFSDGVSDSYLLQFQKRCSRYESFMWPMSMIKPFASAISIAKHIKSDSNPTADKILVLAGTKDRLMTVPVTEQTAAFYRQAGKNLGWKSDEARKSDGRDSARDGVRLSFVEGAGHHVQNDVQWRVGAEKLLDFYQVIAGI